MVCGVRGSPRTGSEAGSPHPVSGDVCGKLLDFFALGCYSLTRARVELAWEWGTIRGGVSCKGLGRRGAEVVGAGNPGCLPWAQNRNPSVHLLR